VRLHSLNEEIPLTAAPGFRKRNYQISDPYLNFWFRFVVPNRIDIEAGRNDAVLNRVQGSFSEYCGTMFEILATDLIRQGTLMEGKQFSAIGRWWHRETEIDCIALNETTHEIVFCECKWQMMSKREALGVLHRLETKAQEFRWHHDDRKEEFCLIAKGIEGKEELRAQGYLAIDLSGFFGAGP